MELSDRLVNTGVHRLCAACWRSNVFEGLKVVNFGNDYIIGNVITVANTESDKVYCKVSHASHARMFWCNWCKI